MLTSASLQAMLETRGEQVTLRRLGSPNVDVLVWAKVTEYQPQELVGSVIQGDRRLIISNTEIAATNWPGPPKHGDRCLIGARPFTVQGVGSTSLGGQVVKYELQARGA